MIMEKAIFAAGCFWGVEDAFRKISGITATAVGYCGGDTINPSYEDVCTGRTGHAEVVMVEYDPSNVAYEELLDTFWQIHDPTQVNRQGPDFGSQYRSAILTLDDDQAAAARTSKEAVTGKFRNAIATVIEPARDFFMAEDYHQQYVDKRQHYGQHY